MKLVSLQFDGTSLSVPTQIFIVISITTIGLALLSGWFDSYMPFVVFSGFLALIWAGCSPQIALACYLLTFSYGLPLIDIGAEFYLDDFLFVLLLVLLIGHLLLAGQQIDRGQSGKMLFIFWCVATLLTAANVWRFDSRQLVKSAFSIFRLGEYILAYVVVSTFVQEREQARRLLIVLIIGASWVVLAGIYQWAILHRHVVVSTLSTNHAHIGVYIIITFFIVMTFFYKNKNFAARSLLVALMILMLLVLIESRSRAAWVGFAMAFVTYTFLRKSRSLFAFIVLVAIIWGATQYVPQTLRERVEFTFQNQNIQPSIDLSTMGRLYIWHGIAQMMASPLNFLFGAGLGAFQFVIRPYVPLFTDGATGAHNNFLHLLTEIGICGLILFVALIWRIGSFGLHVYRQSPVSSEQRDFAIAYLSILVGLVGTMPAQETFSVQEAMASFLGFWMFAFALMEKLMLPPTGKEFTCENR